jgi:hypothetical protein
MSTQVQYRRGTNAQNAAFTGALAEITVDTTNGTLRVHDGITAGGSNIATVSYVTAQIGALSANSISSGTSSVAVIASGGNIRANVAGSTVQTISAGLVAITGDLSVTGNATLSGNILGDRVQNGTTSFDIQTPSGNANITIGATSNVAVFSTAGANISGALGVTGNITGSFILGNGSQLTGIDATSIQSGTSNVRVVSSGGNVTTSVGGTANVVVVATTGANITGTLSVTGNITGGNLSGTSIAGTLTTSAQTNITSVGTLGSLSVTGNITGGNILGGANVNATTHTGSTVNVSGAVTGGSLSVSTGNITGGNLILSGAIEDSAQLDIRTTASNGNIVLTPNGTGVIVAAKDIVNGQANGVGNIGSSTTFFNTVFAKATSAQYADLAEMYVADADYPPGTVVEFGGDKEITISSSSHSTAVAGIVSTNPSYLMNSTQSGEHVLPIALTGRVPCQVQGPVRKGDVLVASSTPGVAQRIGMNWQPGCVVGKSMEVINTAEIRTIEVAVGRL